MDFNSIFVGFILGVLSNYTYDKLRNKFRNKKVDNLKFILDDKNSWKQGDNDKYYYEKEPEYKIKIDEGQDVLWSKYKKFPDNEHDTVSRVQITYNDSPLFGWNFMNLDGYRILVPVPRSEIDVDGNAYDYYDLSSREIKVFEIIGRADLIGEGSKIDELKKVARFLKIKITSL